MGKHKEKSRKHKKDKHKKKNQHKKFSSSSSSSSNDEWVERKSKESSSEDDLPKEDFKSKELINTEAKPVERDEWMNLCTKFSSTSHLDRRKEKEEIKKRDNISKQYNPGQCSRELNPYWKDGGDGLPKFMKPSDDSSKEYSKRSNDGGHRSSSWRKNKQEDPRSSSSAPATKDPVPSSSKLPETEVPDLSGVDLNALGAKLVKAEIMGNTKLVAELKEKLEAARKAAKSSVKEDNVLLTHTDSKGYSRPVKQQRDFDEPTHKRAKKVQTHQDGERMRYFADDDKYSLKQMFENEKYNTIDDQNSQFMKAASKLRKNDDLDEVFSENIRQKESDHKIDSRNKDRAIQEHQSMSKSLDNCNRCIQADSMLKHLMVSMGETAYLSLPSHEPLTKGHCLIVPIKHSTCSTQLDENEWSEIRDIQKALIKMFTSRDEDVVFFETAMNLNRFPHMYIECVPLPREEGDLAPIYFKKAIDESEIEWAQNKKLVPLKGRDVRRAIPKGLPYFCVNFGINDGYAHVIEDEQIFPHNFAQEIIGGMLDLHHSKWRKPKRQSFDEQSKRVLEFSQKWSKFDICGQ